MQRTQVDATINDLISVINTNDRIYASEHRMANKVILDYVDQQDNIIFSQLNFKAPIVNGKVPAHYLPSYMDDVLEFDFKDEPVPNPDNKTFFPAVGEKGKLYTSINNNRIYRWGGSSYVQVGGTDEIPTLQQITDSGNISTNDIVAYAFHNLDSTAGITENGDLYGSMVYIGTPGSAKAALSPASLTTNRQYFFPDAAGTIALEEWVNSRGFLTALPDHNHDERYVLKAGDIMTGRLQVGSGIGSVRLQPGGAVNAGYIEFMRADGSTRIGYIGFNNTDLYYGAETGIHNFGGSILSNSIIEGASIKRTGGLSTQFLKADGSIDSNTYLTSYTEVDTLQSVVDRGHISNKALFLRNGNTLGDEQTVLNLGNFSNDINTPSLSIITRDSDWTNIMHAHRWNGRFLWQRGSDTGIKLGMQLVFDYNTEASLLLYQADGITANTVFHSGNHIHRTDTQNDGRYQPLENQRLSSTNNVQFNNLTAGTIYSVGGALAMYLNGSLFAGSSSDTTNIYAQANGLRIFDNTGVTTRFNIDASGIAYIGGNLAFHAGNHIHRTDAQNDEMYIGRASEVWHTSTDLQPRLFFGLHTYFGTRSGYSFRSATDTDLATIDSSGAFTSNDITIVRSANSGALYFGTTGARWLYWDGNTYTFNGAELVVNGGTVFHTLNHIHRTDVQNDAIFHPKENQRLSTLDSPTFNIIKAGSNGYGQVEVGNDDGTNIHIRALDSNRNLNIAAHGTGGVTIGGHLAWHAGNHIHRTDVQNDSRYVNKWEHWNNTLAVGNPSTNGGKVIIVPAGAENSGYVEFMQGGTGNRIGYIGFNNTEMYYAAEIGNHLFSGGITTNSFLSVTGASTLSGTLSMPNAPALDSNDILVIQNGLVGYTSITNFGFLTSETDPAFTASPASSIGWPNIQSWDTAYNWGNHAAQGYLKVETDPIFTSLDQHILRHKGSVGTGAVITTEFDAITTTGIYNTSENLHSEGLMVYSFPNSSLGTVQTYFSYNGDYRWRNKTDNTTWSSWRNIATQEWITAGYHPLENQRLSTTSSPSFSSLIVNGIISVAGTGNPQIHFYDFNTSDQRLLFRAGDELRWRWNNAADGSGDGMILHTLNHIHRTDSANDLRYQPLENQRLSTTNIATFMGLHIADSNASVSSNGNLYIRGAGGGSIFLQPNPTILPPALTIDANNSPTFFSTVNAPSFYASSNTSWIGYSDGSNYLRGTYNYLTATYNFVNTAGESDLDRIMVLSGDTGVIYNRKLSTILGSETLQTVRDRGHVISTYGGSWEHGYAGNIRLHSLGAEAWSLITFPDTTTASGNTSFWFIGRGAGYSTRTLAFMVPNWNDYGNAGLEPTFSFHVNGIGTPLLSMKSTVANFGVNVTAPNVIYGDNTTGVISIGSANDITKAGFYYIGSNTMPTGTDGAVIAYGYSSDIASWQMQIGQPFHNVRHLYKRRKRAAAWEEWQMLYDNENHVHRTDLENDSRYLQLAGGVMNNGSSIKFWSDYYDPSLIGGFIKATSAGMIVDSYRWSGTAEIHSSVNFGQQYTVSNGYAFVVKTDVKNTMTTATTERLVIDVNGNVAFVNGSNSFTYNDFNILHTGNHMHRGDEENDMHYQPLEDQRLSTTHTPTFSYLSITNNLLAGGTISATMLFLYDAFNSYYSSIESSNNSWSFAEYQKTNFFAFAGNDKQYLFPDANGTIALQEWVTANFAPAGSTSEVDTLASVTARGSFTTSNVAIGYSSAQSTRLAVNGISLFDDSSGNMFEFRQNGNNTGSLHAGTVFFQITVPGADVLFKRGNGSNWLEMSNSTGQVKVPQMGGGGDRAVRVTNDGTLYAV